MENLKERMRGLWIFFSIILALLVFSPITWQAFAGNNGNGPPGTTDVPGANKWHVQRQDNLIIDNFTLWYPIFNTVEMRTSATGDLVIEVDAVCAVGIFDVDLLQAQNLYPDIDFDGAIGKVEVAVFVDGYKLDPGWVNFCDRSVFELSALFQEFCSIDIDTMFFDFSVSACANVFNASLDIFSTAAGFKWYDINVGNGTHEIKVKARIIGVPIDLGGIVFGALKERNLTVFTQTTLQGPNEPLEAPALPEEE